MGLVRTSEDANWIRMQKLAQMRNASNGNTWEEYNLAFKDIIEIEDEYSLGVLENRPIRQQIALLRENSEQPLWIDV